MRCSAGGMVVYLVCPWCLSRRSWSWQTRRRTAVSPCRHSTPCPGIRWRSLARPRSSRASPRVESSGPRTKRSCGSTTFLGHVVARSPGAEWGRYTLLCIHRIARSIESFDGLTSACLVPSLSRGPCFPSLWVSFSLAPFLLPCLFFFFYSPSLSSLLLPSSKFSSPSLSSVSGFLVFLSLFFKSRSLFPFSFSSLHLDLPLLSPVYRQMFARTVPWWPCGCTQRTKTF